MFVFETHQVKVDESTLTGESHSVEIVQLKGDYSLGDRVNLGKGTFITNGRASAYVTWHENENSVALLK
jgi:Ca2+-transporting ATPase